MKIDGLQKRFEEETGLKAYTPYLGGGNMVPTSEYVAWLEEQIKNKEAQIEKAHDYILMAKKMYWEQKIRFI